MDSQASRLKNDGRRIDCPLMAISIVGQIECLATVMHSKPASSVTIVSATRAEPTPTCHAQAEFEGMMAMLGVVDMDGSSLTGRPAEARDDSRPHSSAKPFFSRIRLTFGAITLIDSSGRVKKVPVV